MFDSYYVMTFSAAITSVANYLNKIHLITNILNEFNSTYYDDTDYSSVVLFQKYTDWYVNNIYCPDLIK